MAGLERSEISFRRQGSSGLVWDNKVLSGELNKLQPKHEAEGDDNTKSTVKRSQSNGGRHAYRSVNIEPTFEPPSPKVSGCCVCGIFSKPEPAHKRKAGNRK